MKNKKQILNSFGTIIGFIIMVSAITFMRGQENNKIWAIILVGGIGIAADSIVKYLSCKIEGDTPEKKRKYDVEFNDERTVLIRERAGSKTNSTMLYLMCLVVFIFIILDAPLIYMIIIGILLFAQGILSIFYYNYYDKRL